jgi:hypothetical protein
MHLPFLLHDDQPAVIAACPVDSSMIVFSKQTNGKERLHKGTNEHLCLIFLPRTL